MQTDHEPGTGPEPAAGPRVPWNLGQKPAVMHLNCELPLKEEEDPATTMVVEFPGLGWTRPVDDPTYATATVVPNHGRTKNGDYKRPIYGGSGLMADHDDGIEFGSTPVSRAMWVVHNLSLIHI